MNDSPELAVAREAVRVAAQLCRRVQADLRGAALDKSDQSPVTVADFAAQAVVCRALERAFPDDPVVGEEDSAALRSPAGAGLLARVVAEAALSGLPALPEQVCAAIDRGACRAPGRRFWTLDPIDGTRGFLRGEQYAVALALVVDGRLELAVVAAPNLPVGPGAAERGVCFHALRGGGAWAAPLDRPEQAPVRLHVSEVAEPALASLCQSFESRHSDQEWAARAARQLGLVRAPARLDSLAKYGLLARGEHELYWRLPRSRRPEQIWDHAAGILLVEEAGGRVSDLDGRPLRYEGPTFAGSRGIVASNGPLHEPSLAALRATQPAGGGWGEAEPSPGSGGRG